MKLRHARFHLWAVGILSVAGLLTAGCVRHEPPAWVELAQVGDAIREASQNGVADRFPGELVALKRQYQEARGVYYTCWENKAYQMAKALQKQVKKLSELPTDPIPNPSLITTIEPVPAKRPTRVQTPP